MRAWAGRSEDELVELGERLFVQGIAGSLYPEAWRLVAAHLQAGHTVVLASSATRFQVEPAARAMGVEHVLVSPVEIEDGICTGRPGRAAALAGRQGGRRAGVRRTSTASTWRSSYAYSNGDEDVPVPAHRRPGAGAQPRQRAGRGRPPLLVADRPVPLPRPRRAAETSPAPSAGVGGLLGGFARRAGRRRAQRLRAARRSTSASPSAASSAARWPASGSTSRAPSTWPTRPAVFLFNHQSQLDVLVLAKLLRGGFTAVAKKELANAPGFGLMFRLADVAFVDRGDPAKARAGAGAGGASGCARASRWSSRRRAPARRRRASARSRRAPSTSRCRPACRSCRSSSATPAS